MRKLFSTISPCAVCDGRRSSPKHFLSKATSHAELASQFAAPSIRSEAQQLQMQHGDQEPRNTDSHSEIAQLSFMQKLYIGPDQLIPRRLYADYHKVGHFQDVPQSYMRVAP